MKRLAGSLLLLVLLWSLVNWAMPWDAADFFPFWFAPQQIARHGTLYGPESTATFVAAWTPTSGIHDRAGSLYPLPTVVVWSWLALLPFSLALIALLAVTAGLVNLGLGLFPGEKWEHIAILAGSYAACQCVLIANVTAPLFGFLLVFLWLDSTERYPGAQGILAGLLVLKPQLGGIFVAWWVWRQFKRSGWFGLAMFGATLAITIGASFLVDRGWIAGWREQLAIFNRVLYPFYAPWWVGLILIAGYRRPWWVWAALLTAVAFPVVIIGYPLVPLMLYWLQRGGRSSVAGSAFSMLAIGEILPFGWLYIAGPIIIAGAYDLVQARRQHR